jgi:hypothetical protein
MGSDNGHELAEVRIGKTSADATVYIVRSRIGAEAHQPVDLKRARLSMSRLPAMHYRENLIVATTWLGTTRVIFWLAGADKIAMRYINWYLEARRCPCAGDASCVGRAIHPAALSQAV